MKAKALSPSNWKATRQVTDSRRQLPAAHRSSGLFHFPPATRKDKRTKRQARTHTPSQKAREDVSRFTPTLLQHAPRVLKLGAHLLPGRAHLLSSTPASSRESGAVVVAPTPTPSPNPSPRPLARPPRSGTRCHLHRPREQPRPAARASPAPRPPLARSLARTHARPVVISLCHASTASPRNPAPPTPALLPAPAHAGSGPFPGQVREPARASSASSGGSLARRGRGRLGRMRARRLSTNPLPCRSLARSPSLAGAPSLPPAL